MQRKRGKGGGKEGHFSIILKGKLEWVEKMRDRGKRCVVVETITEKAQKDYMIIKSWRVL